MDTAIRLKWLVAYAAWRMMQEWIASAMKEETIHLQIYEYYNQED